MNFRLPAVLLGIVLVVGVVLLIMSYGEKGTNTDGLTIELTAAGVTADKPEGVDAVEFEKADGSVLLVTRTDKERNLWEIRKPLTARADAAKVAGVIAALLRAKPAPYGELSSNPAAHGLQPAGVKVTLRQGGDRSSTVNLGDVTFGDKGVVFVTTSSRPERPMAVRRSELEALFREPGKDGKSADLVKWTADFRTPNLFPINTAFPGQDIARLKLELPNKKKEVTLSRSGDGWKFDSPAGWGDADVEGDDKSPPGQFTGVAPIVRALANVSALTPTDFIDNPKPLAEYGLNPDYPDRVRVEIMTKDGQKVVAFFGKMELAAAPKPPAPQPGMPPQPPPPQSGSVYVQIEGVPGVVKASATNLGGLAAVITDPNPLRDRTLVAVSAAKPVDGIDIILAGQPPDRPTKLRKVENEWRLYGGPGDPQKAHELAVTPLVNALSARRVIKDFPQPNPANFATVSATLFVWTGGFGTPVAPKAEPAKKNEPVKLEFGRKDGDTVYVRRTLPGGAVAEFTLPAAVGASDLVQAVTKTRLDLLNQELPSFSDAAASRVTVVGAESYVLDKESAIDPLTKLSQWRFAAPDARKGRLADAKQVEALLTNLATAQGTFGRWVAETPANAADYGLSPPRMKVTVQLGKDESREWEFGKDVPDSDKVYARVSGRPAVFTIQRRAMDEFVKPDLRNRLLFRDLVPEKEDKRPTKVELKGWGAAGFETELVFERNKDGLWAVAKGPPGFAVSPTKVEMFINALARNRIKGFVAGPVLPAHAVADPKANALEVRVTFPGGGQMVARFGAETDNGASYFGWTSWSPDAPDSAVLFDAAPLRDYKNSTGAFAK